MGGSVYNRPHAIPAAGSLVDYVTIFVKTYFREDYVNQYIYVVEAIILSRRYDGRRTNGNRDEVANIR